MDNPLQTAIQAIKAGDKATGRRILLQILKTDRDNETVWLWLSAAVETREQRIHCLNEVLRINPTHPQAATVLAKLQSPPVSPLPRPPVEEPAAPSWLQSPGAPSDRPPQTATSTPPAAPDAQPARPRRGMAWYDVWLSILPSPNERSFRFILADPKLSLDRGLIWIFCTSLIQNLVVLGLFMAYWLPVIDEAAAQAGLTLELAKTIRTASVTVFVAGVPILTSAFTLFFALQVGIQHLIARLMGGQGTYESLLFATAAYQAPIQLIGIIAFFIPYVNLCAGPLLAIFTWVLMANALRAVYNFGIERALAVMFLPGILLFIVCCVAGVALQGSIQQTLMDAMKATPMP